MGGFTEKGAFKLKLEERNASQTEAMTRTLKSNKPEKCSEHLSPNAALFSVYSGQSMVFHSIIILRNDRANDKTFGHTGWI